MSNISIIGSKDGPAVDVRELNDHIATLPIGELQLPERLSDTSLTATYALKDEAGAAGLTAESVAGAVTLPVAHGFTYELTATANATVTLTGVNGTQVALTIVTGGFSVTVAGSVLQAGTYVAHKVTAGWLLYPVGTARTDVTPPTAGTLSVSVTDVSAIISVTGAMDDVALHATPYRFSKDGGTTWTAWQETASYTFTALTQSTSYPFRHQVRDAAENLRAGASVTVSTTATPVWTDVFTDSFTGVADGTSLNGRTTPTGAIAYHSSSTATITGERVYMGVHGSVGKLVLPKSATTSLRFTGAYDIGTVAGSTGGVSLGFTTNDTFNNQLNFNLNHASGTATISFNDVAAGTWTASIPTTTGHPKTGTFSLTFNPAGKSGTLLLNGTQVATFSGDTLVNPTGFYATLSNNFGALDTLKGEVSNA